jgi:pyrimidine deaminase RibD-like protein
MDNQDYKCMEETVEYMQNCVGEKTTDPKVSAVLITGAGARFNANRGEIMAGDHAEFTLLQKKTPSLDLTKGGILYTTLEPCTARSHNKMSCAQWIIEKQIKRVVIGILDPNPEICGKGYWNLIKAGIEVDFFPSVLAKRIMDANKSFLETHQKPVQISTKFAEISRKYKRDYLTPYIEFGWESCLSIQECPHKRDGWATTQIKIDIDSEEPFSIPSKLVTQYESYFAENATLRGFRQNGKKFMLLSNPVANSDASQPELRVRPTLYSHAMFYADSIAKLPRERDLLIKNFLREPLEAHFAHRLCLHLIIVTEDRKVLITQRAPKVAEAQGQWSASAEE